MTTPVTPATQSGEASKNQWKAILGTGGGTLAAIILICIAWYIFAPTKEDRDAEKKAEIQKTEKTSNSGDNSGNQKTIIKTIHVELGTEYGQTFKISCGTSFTFDDATCNYSVINADGIEASSTDMEDVSDKLGASYGNKLLRFKGNENGSLNINITR